MDYSQNLTGIEPWTTFRPTFSDSWFHESISRDTEMFTKALQQSLSFSSASPTDSLTLPAPLISNVSHVEAPKRQRNVSVSATSGKVSKRKSRASKKSLTTFITADQANFRNLVQQVTGVRYGGEAQASVLKPKPMKPDSTTSNGTGVLLPTLDTSSSFSLNQNVGLGRVGSDFGDESILPFPTTSFVSGLDLDSYSPFPTLESWNVV